MSNSSLAKAFTRLEMDTKELAGFPPNMDSLDAIYTRDRIANQLEKLRNRLAFDQLYWFLPDELKIVLSDADAVLRETSAKERTT
jgi:hypothetical protein